MNTEESMKQIIKLLTSLSNVRRPKKGKLTFGFIGKSEYSKNPNLNMYAVYYQYDK